MESNYISLTYEKKYNDKHPGLTVTVRTGGLNNVIETIKLRFVFNKMESCNVNRDKVRDSYYKKHDLVNYFEFNRFFDRNSRIMKFDDRCFTRGGSNFFDVTLSSEAENHAQDVEFENNEAKKMLDNLTL